MSVDLSQFEGHTPGPWRFDNGVYSGDVGFIMAANGSVVCRFGNSDPPEEPGVPPTGADRLLIENAPALLADLRAAREALRKIAYDPIGDADASAAEVLEGVTAIARAAMEGVKE